MCRIYLSDGREFNLSNYALYDKQDQHSYNIKNVLTFNAFLNN